MDTAVLIELKKKLMEESTPPQISADRASYHEEGEKAYASGFRDGEESGRRVGLMDAAIKIGALVDLLG